MKIAVHGAAGRMGQRVVAVASADSRYQVVAALESATHPALGQDAGLLAGVGNLGVPLAVVGESDADVVIDFSVPDAAIAVLTHCLEFKKPLVIATTGFDVPQDEFIRESARTLPIVWAPSMSPAVNLLMKLTEIAAISLRELPTGVDVEIIERHHRFKEDAPSGTALRFGNIVAEAMGQSSHIHGRHGRPGERPRNEIGYHALRSGDNPGEHTIVFGMLGETIELKVAASNRDCYAQGALLAADWIIDKPAGLYSMNDVLGL
ncbi:4-hydroxy-tetrahydrodipicolinate reductase [Bythopirellula polymerisocia]|uniref:4-hydroxy-tetrahydrodipicolinate reductase n=1 Tax=Bythopirellula polymerisocia TaxID=2528003 RepID=A0A5C6CEQ7_9BACT|nr:4-hydroxy-tetrahydrodipicolinate reductase [Bythopirellula polymerisocia]TWU21911.1 4-hydroxy-tetrahydrodipicolinate reductase [Bythopirellula polymerisocia]